ncbi:hypothetical protein ACFORL_05200 [Legionella dresdenensis]|uniref:Uncharacterized protein n=1 Tax=Legionella dresdenensis TaxID=450200 RepID=A0ABV8CE93_9GAMM
MRTFLIKLWRALNYKTFAIFSYLTRIIAHPLTISGQLKNEVE